MQMEKGHFFILFFKWVHCGSVSIGQLLGPNAYVTYNEFKTTY